MKKRPRLNWRRQPREKYTAGEELGHQLRHAGTTVGFVGPIYEGWGRRKRGYYCYGRWPAYGVPHINTTLQPVATVEEAKAFLLKHFNDHIERYLQQDIPT